MNKLIKKLLVASLVTFTGIAQAGDTTTAKTHMQPRSAAVNLAFEKATWHTQIDHKYHKEDDKVGASLQAVGFYESSTNKSGLGKYFGFDNMNLLTVGAAAATTAGRIDRRNLIHMPLSTPSTSPILPYYPASFAGGILAGNLKLEFTHNQGGVNLFYRQAIDGLLKGLYFQASLPIVWSQTKSKLNLSSSTSETQVANAALVANSAAKSVADYFSGNITQTAGSNYQTALQHAKITGNKSKTSIPEIPFKLGWNFWSTEKHHAGINLGVVFPTGPKGKSEFLFEPLGGGNGQHWGLGAGIDTKFTPWKHAEQSLNILLVMDYRYLFKNSETRTLGLKDIPWSQYMLYARVGTAGVEPLAELLTDKCNVTPGSQVDFLAGLAYNCGGFTFDLGYELYAREREKVSKKFTIDETAATGYALAANDYDAHSVFAFTNGILKANADISATRSHEGAAAATTQILNSDIDTSVAQTPSQVTNKIYGGIGYSFNKWETPLMLGLGGEYEFASKQKALENWGVNAKIGISF